LIRWRAGNAGGNVGGTRRVPNDYRRQRTCPRYGRADTAVRPPVSAELHVPRSSRPRFRSETISPGRNSKYLRTVPVVTHGDGCSCWGRRPRAIDETRRRKLTGPAEQTFHERAVFRDDHRHVCHHAGNPGVGNNASESIGRSVGCFFFNGTTWPRPSVAFWATGPPPLRTGRGGTRPRFGFIINGTPPAFVFSHTPDNFRPSPYTKTHTGGGARASAVRVSSGEYNEIINRITVTGTRPDGNSFLRFSRYNNKSEPTPPPSGRACCGFSPSCARARPSRNPARKPRQGVHRPSSPPPSPRPSLCSGYCRTPPHILPPSDNYLHLSPTISCYGARPRPAGW